MKKILLMAVLFGAVNFSYASFPVNKKNVEKAGAEIESLIDLQETQNITAANFELTESEVLSPAVAAAGSNDNMWIAAGLWFFLGGFAAHRWYAKKPVGWNILFILTLGGLAIWWLVDGINILSDNFFD